MGGSIFPYLLRNDHRLLHSSPPALWSMAAKWARDGDHFLNAIIGRMNQGQIQPRLSD